MNSKYLHEHLNRDGNNIDLIRLIAASAVIYGHAFGLLPAAGGVDLVQKYTGFYAADLAVKCFFFLSGLLVTNSILNNKSVSIYVINRFFRIIPGLVFVVVFTAVIIGPIFTSLPIFEYLKSEQVYQYIIHMSTLQSWGTQGLGYYDLPGMFLDNPFPKNTNAPLWTLSVEVFAYVLILAAFLVGATNKRVAIIVFLAIIIDAFLPKPILFHWIPENSRDFSFIPFCFAFGGLFAVYKEQIKVGLEAPLGLLLLYILFKGNQYESFIFYMFFFIFIIYFSTLPLVMKFRLRSDLSYGVYLWGWPIQQILAQQFPSLNIITFQIGALALAIFFSYISWTFVEKPSIRLGKHIGRKMMPRLRAR